MRKCINKMPIRKQIPCIQVGNETYSLEITEEEWEKRKYERERSRQLSIETNQRRKGLEEKRKLAEERENRKRELELGKRHQRQIEATERYQRAHLGPREKRYALYASQSAKQQTESRKSIPFPSTSPDFSESTNSSCIMNVMYPTEAQKRRMIEQYQQKNIQEQYRSHGIASQDSVASCMDTNKTSTFNDVRDHIQSPDDYTAESDLMLRSCSAASNIDIMSGQSCNSFFPTPPHAIIGHVVQPKPKVKSMSPNFLRQFSEKNNVDDSPMEKEIIIQMSDNSINKKSEESSTENDHKPAYHDQESLHGSNSSVLPPPESVSDIPKSINDNLEGMQTTLGSQLFRLREVEAMQTKGQLNGLQQMDEAISAIAADSSTMNSTITAQRKQTETFSSVAKPELLTAPVSYYIKAYRPRSGNVFVNSESHQKHSNETTFVRPSSSYELRKCPLTTSSSASSSLIPCKSSSISSMQINKSTSENQYKNLGITAANVYQREAAHTPVTRVHPSRSLNNKIRATPISSIYDINNEIKNETGKIDSAKGPFEAFVFVAKHANPEFKIPRTKTNDQLGSENRPSSVTRLHAPIQTEESELNLCDNSSKTKSAKLIRGILRMTSKYDKRSPVVCSPTSSPAYQSAILARQKWVKEISTDFNPDRVLSTKKGREQRPHTVENEPKSVRWHEVLYNDGTSSTLTELDTVQEKKQPIQKPSYASTTNKSVGNPKTGKLKSATEAGKVGRGKRGKVKKQKSVKEIPSQNETRIAEKKTKHLNMSTVVNYSIRGDEAANDSETSNTSENVLESQELSAVGKQSISSSKNKIFVHENVHIAWSAFDNEEPVTLNTLKSGGNIPSNTTVSDRKSSKRIPYLQGGDVVVNQGNQVTINVVSNEMRHPDFKKLQGRSCNNSTMPLNHTPTDKEISWLWDKIRSCLAENRDGSDSTSSKIPGKNHHSFTTRPTDKSEQQTSTNILTIQGDMLSGTMSRNRSASAANQRIKGKQRNGRRIIRPNSAIQLSSSIQRQGTERYNSHIQCQRMLQRRQRQLRIQRSDRVKSSAYLSPNPSIYSPSAPIPTVLNNNLTESMATFLLAEKLAKLNIPDEKILQALDSLQQKKSEAERVGYQMHPSSISIDEQKILESLEKLNSCLQQVQKTNPYMKNFLVPNQITKNQA